MSLNIVMVGACPYPVPQGSQVFMRDTALALQARGHRVGLLVYGYGQGEDDSGLPLHRAAKIPGESRLKAGPSWRKPLQDFALLWKLRRILRTEKVDVVCAHNYEALLIALAAGGRPILYFAHNAMSDELPYYFNGAEWAEQLGRWLDRTFPKRADCVVAPQRRLAGHLVVRGCDHSRVRIVPPPMYAALFTPCKVEASIPPVLYTGNLDTYQNLGLLQAAMEQVRRTLPEARLQVATAQPCDFPGIERVDTPDFAALKEILSRDAVFAVPRVSWSGYPIKLLNAMAAGQAIVACESAAYPLTHEVNALVVPDNEPNAFSHALLRLLRDPALRKKLGAAARQKVEQEHSPGLVGESLERIALEFSQSA